MKEDKTYKTFILNGKKEEEVVGLDINSFEYFKVMCDCWSKEDLQYRAWEICVECIEKDKEIERLNNIINELEEWLEIEERKCKKYATDDYEGGYVDAINTTIVKLKELKEGK